MKMLLLTLFMTFVPKNMVLESSSILILTTLSNMFNWTNFSLSKSISMWFSNDLISENMLILSVLLFFLCLTINYFNTNSTNLKNLIVFSTLSMAILFMCSDWISFFMMFEFSLIPISLIILSFGYQPERVEAFYYMFFYTIFFSLPMLFSLLVLKESSIPIMEYLYFSNSSIFEFDSWSSLIFLTMFSALCVKIPMFLFHAWLPKAHVEAPLVGSIILAGILLKMGGYGMYRLLMLWKSILMELNLKNFFFSASIWGMLFICLMCLSESDMKAVIAYSSVSHMNFLMSSIWINKFSSMESSLLLMISHGFSSSFLFFMANWNYSLSKSRSFYMNKFLISSFPLVVFFWFFALMINSSVPPSSGMISELILSLSLYAFIGNMILIFLFLYLVLSGFYSMYFYVKVSHAFGKWEESEYKKSFFSFFDYLVSISHVFFLVLLVVYSYLVIFF